jgi:hypothetical protein
VAETLDWFDWTPEPASSVHVISVSGVPDGRGKRRRS